MWIWLIADNSRDEIAGPKCAINEAAVSCLRIRLQSLHKPNLRQLVVGGRIGTRECCAPVLPPKLCSMHQMKGMPAAAAETPQSQGHTC